MTNLAPKKQRSVGNILVGYELGFLKRSTMFSFLMVFLGAFRVTFQKELSNIERLSLFTFFIFTLNHINLFCSVFVWTLAKDFVFRSKWKASQKH